MAEISSVHIDIARFGREVYRISDDLELAKWTRSLVESLVLRDHSLNEFGSFLLHEVEEYRKKEAERKKSRSKDSALSKDSAESALSDLNQSFNHSIKEKNTKAPSASVPELFETARKAYPGTKNGSDVEWRNFLKKHSKRKDEILPLLIPAVTAFAAHHQKEKTEKRYIPHFQKWINNEGWTEERPDDSAPIQKPKTPWEREQQRRYDEEREYRLNRDGQGHIMRWTAWAWDNVPPTEADRNRDQEAWRRQA